MRKTNQDVVIVAETSTAPPYWALLEREVLQAQSEACEAFYARYFDERGYLQCVPRWGITYASRVKTSLLVFDALAA